MSKDRFNIIVISFCLISLLFPYADAYLIPHVSRAENIIQSTQFKPRYRSPIVYRIESEFSKMDVSEEVFSQFADYDSLIVSRSPVSNVPQSLGRNINGEFQSRGINFMHDSLGLYLAPVFLAFSISLALFYYRIRRSDLKSKLTGLAFILSLSILISYLS
ncbi:MAG: hypothetical protein EOO43_06855 [Flavobacterium sp.]|nr:MAG: hypothetical protein EOO43_06855 [Flavobacterium sp.]